jgi:nitroimidazol reductase NimA-like FMN-containing flavoprotein (pyridoxamine 5'-phosphate oxidase superfamily)
MDQATGLNPISINAQRKPERAREDAWIRAFLHRARFGHVATCRDEQPFITSMLFWYDEVNNAIIFHHSRALGRLRTNLDRNNRVCFETFEAGNLLPSNVALEFSIQYASVVAFGNAQLVEDEVEKRAALNSLLMKYFPELSPGEDYRPITEKELAATNVYAIVIESWSGKENWPDQALQSNAWQPLSGKWLKE